MWQKFINDGAKRRQLRLISVAPLYDHHTKARGCAVHYYAEVMRAIQCWIRYIGRSYYRAS